MYDIIGDVHGQATLLKQLLKSMGYAKGQSGYSHPERKAVFVGDFINRGPEIRSVLQIIRKMTENGHAMAILGNHEVNAILDKLKDREKLPILKKESLRTLSLLQTLQQFRNFPEEWKDHVKWLRSLPLFLDLGDIRVIHACWDDQNIQTLREELPEGKKSKQVFRQLVTDPKSRLSQAILQSTRGIHLVMPVDLAIFDDRRRIHHFYRVRWWERLDGKTFQEISFENKFTLPGYTIPPEILPVLRPYPADAPPVFFGHYSRADGPFVISHNLCCVDSSVHSTARLAAYRWDGEKVLDPDKMVFIS
jgi:hypothetical protein